ncbi:MAG: hypothetical protein ACKO0M_14295, partial [Cyanobium sp.]
LSHPLPRSAQDRLVELLEAIHDSSSLPHRRYVPSAGLALAYRLYFADQEQDLLHRFFPGRPSLWHRPCMPSDEPDASAEDGQSSAVSCGEEMLCRAIVALSVERNLPLQDLVHCLERLAWKGEQAQLLNHYDQQCCRSLAQQLRSSG